MQVDLFQLYRFTDVLISRAREMALGGRKDDARDVLRYLRNGHVIQILKHLDEATYPKDVSHLEWKLGELENECHPQTPVERIFKAAMGERGGRVCSLCGLVFYEAIPVTQFSSASRTDELQSDANSERREGRRTTTPLPFE